MAAYYNEIEPFAAQWLRNLIAANLIAPGDVDERSIVDVRPDDLRGYKQCHFFAGIGVWSYALRLADWPDDRPIWTGSCPCQPFSAAGRGAGIADARHLWPAWWRIIAECCPATLIGEQVGGTAGYAWLDHVFADLEDGGYACAAADFPAASVGAPHIRQRLYWVAVSEHFGHQRRVQASPGTVRWRPAQFGLGNSTDGLAHAGIRAGEWDAGELPAAQARIGRARIEHGHMPERHCDGRPTDGLADAASAGAVGGQRIEGGEGNARGAESGGGGAIGADGMGDTAEAGREMPLVESRHGTEAHGQRSASDAGSPRATNGFWRDAIWLPCRDGKARPVEPGLEPLVAGAAARMGFVCPGCLQVHPQDPHDEGLRAMREILGETHGRLAAEVLQPFLHGRGVHEATLDQGSRALPSAALLRGEGVRTLRQDGAIPASASQGREPDEQRAREHHGSVRDVPCEGTREDACSLCGAEADWLAEAHLRGDRVGRLRAYGNCIVAPQAQAFIECMMECLP